MVFARLAAAALALASAAAAPFAYRIETAAGSDVLGDGGPAVDAQLGFAQGIAIDRQRNIYIADTENHRIRKVTRDGRIATVAGSGRRGMSGDGGPAVRAQLDRPYGLALDAAGNLYIADLGNHRVRRVSADGVISTYAGAGGKGSRGDGGPAVDAQLMSPRNLAFDAAGNLFISEFDGHRVRRVSPQGVISTFAGNGIAGLRGDGGPAVAAQLAAPAGLAMDLDGGLFIADSANHRIRKVLTGGNIITYMGGAGDAVAFSTPVAVAVDAKGNLYVAERVPQVRRFTPGREPQVAAGTGAAGYDGDGRSAETSLLLAPADLALDDGGNLYIVDGRRVRRVAATKQISTIAGDAYMRVIGDNGPAAAACLNRPSGLAMDPAGNLYVADSGTNRVRRISPAGQIVTLAGSGLQGFVDNVAPGVARLYSPAAVAADGPARIFVADTSNHRVRQIFPGSLIRTVAGSGGAGLGADGRPGLETPLHGPRGLASDGRGNLYISDTLGHRVMIQLPSGVLLTVAGNASAGFGGDGGRAELAQLFQPNGIAADGAGNLYIADTGNHRIRKVDASGIITTIAGDGVEGFYGDGGPALRAALSFPRAVAADGNGNVYIADTGNCRIRRVGADGIISTIAGTGYPGFAGDGGFALEAELNLPEGILIDGSGNLWVSDTGNHRVRKLVPVAAAPVEIAEAVVVNAASMLPGPVAPGAMVAVFAPKIGPERPEPGSLDANGTLRTRIGDTEVLFNGEPAPLFHAQSNQVNAQAPYGIAARGVAQVEVRVGGALRARAVVTVAPSAPGIFTAAGGRGPAVAINQDGTLNSESNPAARGSTVTLFATGEGLTEPAAVAGRPAQPPYARPLLPVILTMGGSEAGILYAGQAPGFAGLMQINARVPAGFVPPGLLRLELAVGGAASQPGVTIAVR